MKKIILSIMAFVLLSGIAQATLTVNNVPKTNTGGSSPTIINSSITAIANGNVGIGSVTPSQVLDVNGTIKGLGFSGSGASLIGVPISTGVSGLGTGVGTFLGTPTSANLATALTDETGSGAAVFASSATLVNPALGTPASGVATNLTGTASGLTAGTVSTINGLIAQGTNVTITGSGTSGSPYTITSSGGGGSGSPGGISTQLQQNLSGNFAGANVYQLSGGNVGIGTATPGQLLDVNGTIRSLSASFSGPGNVGIGSTNPGTSLDVKGTVRALGYNLATTTTIGFVLTAIDSTGDVGFSASSGGSGTPSGISSQFQYNLSNAFAGANVYQSGGNVGIGSATPGQLLDVNGTIRTNTSFISTASGLSSFTGGNVGIGSVNPGQILDVTGTVRMSGAIFDTGITTDATKTDATLCEDTTTHQFYSGSGTLGICLGTSSARYKNNINVLGLGLSSINQLKPVTFFYNNGYGDNGARLQYGLLAEDVVKVIPNLVALDKNNAPNSVDLLGMVPILINSIKTQQKEIFLLMLGFFTFFVFLVFKK